MHVCVSWFMLSTNFSFSLKNRLHKLTKTTFTYINLCFLSLVSINFVPKLQKCHQIVSVIVVERAMLPK